MAMIDEINKGQQILWHTTFTHTKIFNSLRKMAAEGWAEGVCRFLVATTSPGHRKYDIISWLINYKGCLQG